MPEGSWKYKNSRAGDALRVNACNRCRPEHVIHIHLKQICGSQVAATECCRPLLAVADGRDHPFASQISEHRARGLGSYFMCLLSPQHISSFVVCTFCIPPGPFEFSAF